MGITTPGPLEATCYYKAALACLQFVEARRPTKRRFGPDADARWKALRGHLSANDRIDLLLRDANAEWPGSFGAREVFALHNVAEDEAFGASWTTMDPVRGEEVWRELALATPPATAGDVLASVADAWGLRLQPIALDPVDATDRWVVAGPSAVAALAQAFLGRADLDWSAQVTCIATPPAHRHIAVTASAVVDSHKQTRVVSAVDFTEASSATRKLTSDDAFDADLRALQGAG